MCTCANVVASRPSADQECGCTCEAMFVISSRATVREHILICPNQLDALALNGMKLPAFDLRSHATRMFALRRITRHHPHQASRLPVCRPALTTVVTHNTRALGCALPCFTPKPAMTL